MDKDKKMTVEMLLNERVVPPMRSGLPEQIIAAAQTMQQEHVVQTRVGSVSSGAGGFKTWWNDFWDGFVVPQPALVMSLVLLVGVMIGTYTEPVGTSDTVLEDATSYELVLTQEADLNIESWL